VFGEPPPQPVLSPPDTFDTRRVEWHGGVLAAHRDLRRLRAAGFPFESHVARTYKETD
jgi:hypothetical protein